MKLINSEETYTTNNMIADVILSLLKDRISGSEHPITIEVGTFDNCREYGNTYRVVDAKQDYTFCVYEHRNSDNICINGCPTDEMKSYGPYSGGTKWDWYFSASYDEFYKVAAELHQMLIGCRDGVFVDKFKQEK